ncbi:helix-turn-helix domain-containing protein [Actinomadura sp. NTSP31]|uniref:PucR family transcriptional regulator n=1 Tax=Actinomadura sp. NTSP31 TaxID=1735447 RepID=UPI0035BEEB85
MVSLSLSEPPILLTDPLNPRHRSPHRLGDLLRPHIEPVTEEIAQEIRRHVPAFALPADGHPGCQLLAMVGLTVRGFVDSVDEPAPDLAPITEGYRRLGVREAQHGRGLDNLEAALRLSSQIVCRRLIHQTRILDSPHDVLAILTERLFQFLGRLVNAAARGHAAAHHRLTTEREQRRAYLRDAIVADPPTSREAVVELAGAAGWTAPDTVCAIVPHSPASVTRLLPPTVLTDWSGHAPYLIVPDPEGPGQRLLMDRLAESCPGTIGPAVPLERGANSLRWARRGAALVSEGALPAAGAVRCVDHIATLTAHLGRDLVDAAAPQYLQPLLEEPTPRRETLAETLLSHLTHGGNAVNVGKELHIHPQTVRYRMRVIQNLFGGELPGPESRLATMIALNALLHLSAPATGPAR